MRIGGEHASPTPRRARTAASRMRPSSKLANACVNSPRWSRSSPGTCRRRMRSRRASLATAREMDLMGQWVLGMQGPSRPTARASRPRTSASSRFRLFRAAKARRPITRRYQWLPRHQDGAKGDGRLFEFLHPGNTPKRRRRPAAISQYTKAQAAVKDPLVKHLADDLAVTTYHQNFSIRSRALGRSGHQRYLGRGRGRRNEARRRRRCDPGGGRPAIGSWSERSVSTSPSFQGEVESRDTTGGSFS